MIAAIYSTWFSNQSGKDDISPVHIEAVLVDFIVPISARFFHGTQNSACPWFGFNNADANQGFGSAYRIRLLEGHQGDALQASPIKSDQMK
jgi:hypothetical protein